MINMFSKRNALQAEKTNPYTYDRLPEPLKFQVIRICEKVEVRFPDVSCRGADVFYVGVQQTLCEEYGLMCLTNNTCTYKEDVWNYFMQNKDANKCLDVIEIVFAKFIKKVQADKYVNCGMNSEIAQAAKDINLRFREHSMGYEFQDWRFIRLDSEYLHTETVVPALVLLREPYLAGANEEFAKAQDHFRHGRFGESINECLKAFESTMKGICHKRDWAYNQTDSAKKLLATCEQNGLFPDFMRSSLDGLRSVLESEIGRAHV